jgi:hypothetical protein
MNLIIYISFAITVILTTGVYLTGSIDQRQYEKFGFTGARFLIITYCLIYGFINIFIMLNLYNVYISYDSHGLLSTIFFVFFILVCIGIVHTDTENSLIEYFYDISPLKNYFIDIDKYYDDEVD